VLTLDFSDPTVECFEPVVAPPVLTVRPELTPADRFDDAVVEVSFDPVPDEPGFAELPPGELEFEPAADDPVDASAQATPYPVENNAAPTPRATANPPTRPTNLEAPMVLLLTQTGDLACSEGNSQTSAGLRIRQLCQF
jgi:hypothetical protein